LRIARSADSLGKLPAVEAQQAVQTLGERLESRSVLVSRRIAPGWKNAMPLRITAVGRPDVPEFSMPERFRHDVSYFMTAPDEAGVPSLGPGEYWIRREEARQWLDDGVFRLISPLDSANRTEIELSEEQEAWLEWMVQHGVEHIRLA
jgi:hypothetical protein